MASFAYTAADAAGRTVNGSVEAPMRADALRQLAAQGLQALDLKEDSARTVRPAQPAAPVKAKVADQTAAGSKAEPWPSGPIRLKASHLLTFTDELAELLESGLKLEPALRNMESGMERTIPPHRQAAGRLGEMVREGHRFHAALRQVSPSFNDLYCSVAQAGSAGGALGASLRRLHTYLASVGELRSRLMVALIYPSFLMLAGLGVTVLFVTYLIPNLIVLMQSTRGTMPGIATFLLAVSAFIKGWWWLILAVLAAGWMLARWWVRTPAGRALWDQWSLRLPLAGHLTKLAFYTQYFETLSSLSHGGLPLLRAMELAAPVTRNGFLQGRLTRAADAVREGASLSRALQRTEVFPPQLVEMTRLGEHTGEMAAALRRVADRCHRDFGRWLERLTALVQPVIIMAVAVVVGVMAWMMISVIFDTISGLRYR